MVQTITAFTATEKAAHSHHRWAFLLNRENFHFWKTMVEPFFSTYKLVGYLDGTIPCPSSTMAAAENATVPNPNFATWTENDAHVKMILLSSISEQAYSAFYGKRTSHEIWDALHRAYEPATLSRELTLKTNLLKLEIESDESITAYLQRAKGYADSLASIGEPVREKDLILTILAGLSSRTDLNSLVTMLTARGTAIKIDDLQALLSDHEFVHSRSKPNINQAYNVQTNTPVSGNQPTKQVASSLNYQQLIAQAQALGLSVVPTITTPQAFYSNRNNRGGNRAQCPNHRNNTSPQPQPTAHFSTNRTSPSAPTWFPDTGANNHVSPDLSSFDFSEAYHGPDTLHVGNGSGHSNYPPHRSEQ